MRVQVSEREHCRILCVACAFPGPVQQSVVAGKQDLVAGGGVQSRVQLIVQQVDMYSYLVALSSLVMQYMPLSTLFWTGCLS